MDTIHNAPHDVAHVILVALCYNDSDQLTKALKMIRQYENSAGQRKNGLVQPVAGLKRKADASEVNEVNEVNGVNEASDAGLAGTPEDQTKKLLVCHTCNAIFTPATQRGRSVCRFHTRNQYPEEMGRYLFDDEEHYPERRYGYREGYWWLCCRRPVVDETLGCRKRNHHVSLQEYGAKIRRKEERKRAKRAKRLITITALTAPDVPVVISSDEDDDNENLSDDVSDTHPSEDEGPGDEGGK